MEEQPWLNWINAALGVWLVISPLILPFEATSLSWIAIAFVVAGLVQVAFSFAAGSGTATWPRWSIALLGIVVFALPWVMGFKDAPTETWNACLTGAAMVVFGLSEVAGVGSLHARHGG